MAQRVLLCLVFFLCFCVGTVQAQQSGKLSGKVTDKATKEPIPGVDVVVKLNGALRGHATTDDKGFYSVSPLTPGAYSVDFINISFEKRTFTGVPIEVDKTRFLNAELEDVSTTLGTAEVVAYKVPIINPDNTSTGGTLTSDQIMKLPTREVSTLAATTPGVFSSDDNARLNVKGTRETSTVYYVNGVKQLSATAPNLPTSAISQLTVVSGGVPAQYGDAVGGIISITTTSPSNRFSGGIEAETSNLFDKYKTNLINANIAGPLLRRKAADGGESPGSLLGFFAAAQLQTSKDEAPLYNGLYQVKADKLKQIQDKPFTNLPGEGVVQSAALLTLNDLEKSTVRPNAAMQRQTYNVSLDFQPIDNIMFTMGGSYDRYRQDVFSANSSLFNSVNNPRRFTTNWNTFARFTQNFPSSGEAGLLKNAFYQVQADFTRYDRSIMSDKYKDDFARYGYIGRLRENTTPGLGFAGAIIKDPNDSTRQIPVLEHVDVPTSVSFTPSGDNPLLANYTNQLLTDRELGLNITSINTLLGRGGIRNGGSAQLVQNLYNNSGGTNGQYLLQINDQYRVSALGAAEIGKHTVKLGMEFEQRIESFYDARPNAMWGAARGLLNSHITRTPTTMDIVTDSTGQSFYAVQNYDIASNNQETDFSKNFRNQFGDPTDVNHLQTINIDDIDDPSKLRIDQFTATDAINRNIVASYQGYTYTGKRNTSKRVAFSDFFTDEKNRPQDAYRPTYAAAFLEDKFAIEDLIIRAGLRVDRFDANQKVLKDKYSTVDVLTVKDLKASGTQFATGNARDFPSTIGDDFVVYVDQDAERGGSSSGYKVLGFRQGDQFYNAAGARTENLYEVQSQGSSFPYFNPQAQGAETGSSLEYVKDRKLSLRAFRDYKPQINVMPRVSFSFPISEDALFFAHYDILTQRPENNPTRPADYYFLKGAVLGSDEGLLNNPDLKPQRKIDMQMGFEQRLTQSSGLTISAFYSELRDLIQYKSVLGAYPNDYITFANIDFGTVKGMTLGYDLRRTKNIAFNASYTLQFAKGTGSNSTSGLNLASQGQPNLRVPIPLDYDQRNQFKGSLDFRFAGNEGPIAFGQRFLQNAGVNILVQGGSGTPYTRQQNVTQEVSIGVQQRAALKGGLNGSRLPGNARVSLRIDKDFALKMGEKQLPVIKTLNIYFRVQNLLNSANVLRVYRFTGSAEDDGYVDYYRTINAGATSQLIYSQADLYQSKLLSNNNYSLPRRMLIGATLTF